MGTINFTVTKANRAQGNNSEPFPSTLVQTSDAYTTSTSASNVEDGSGDISLTVGDIFRCHVSEPMWVNFGGTAATIGDGFYLHTDSTTVFMCDVAGTVSAIDVA